IPINEAVEGDIIITFENGDVQSRKGIKVKKSNIEKINNQIRKGNCFPSGIIMGYDAEFAEGEMGEIERKVIEKEGITPEKFVVHDIPSLSSGGMRRIILSPLKRIRWEMGDSILKLSFSLPKGCYATCLLREFMKTEIKNY
ncbi:MAG: tRNA pseudouridine(13) synthase TruD, partial [Thermoplasmata archaeon]|nr:tRNA pseudouridine(13) synthase TruD [Thermoplasmata archaeon]